MKFLKYLFILLLLIGTIFIGNGFLNPTISYNSEVVVNKSAKEAWAVMNDENKTTQWLKDITKIEHVSGEKGTVGAVTNYTFVQDGQESIIVETMKDIRPYEHVAMDFVMEGVMEMDYQMNFEESGGKTKIQSSTTTKGIGWFMRSLMSFMESTSQAQENENLNNLKKLIDENTTDYFPAPPTIIDTMTVNQE